MVDQIKTEEEELLGELRQKRDEKLKWISTELESASFHVAKACSLHDFASATASKNSLRMMAIHEELIQRMKTVSDIETGTDDDSRTVVSFVPAQSEVKLGKVDLVKGNPDELLSRQSSVSSNHSPRRSLPSISTPFRTKPQQLFAIRNLGSNLGEIKDPLGVAILPNGDIIITEWGNKRLQIFDNVGKPVALIGSGQIGPQGIAITLKGNIMVTDAHNKRLEVFSPEGQSLAKWGLGKFFGPCGVAISQNGNCIVTDIAEHAVSIYQGEKKLYKRFGSKGSKSDQLHNPLYVATGAENEIYVSDSDNHCVKVFDHHGHYIRKIGSEGSGDGQFVYPRGVCLDEGGNVMVADRNNDRVSLFTPGGGFIKHILTKEDGIRDPYAIAITPTRNLVVTSSGAGRASLKMYQL